MLTLFDKLADELNVQIGHEFGAHTQYLALASYFERRNLENLAHFFYAQAEEEKEHGLKIVRHINYAGGEARIPAIPAPKNDFESTEEALQLFVEQETFVTQRFLDMSRLALEEGNFTTFNFLRWYVDEQVEEMAVAKRLLGWYAEAGEERMAQLELLLAEFQEHQTDEAGS
jgi:ferritin